MQNQIPINWKNTYEINIDFFGKKIKCVILLSPSGASNIGISRSEIYLNKQNLYKHLKTPVKQFKIDFSAYIQGKSASGLKLKVGDSSTFL